MFEKPSFKEVKKANGALQTEIGDLSQLSTIEKGSIVGAVNELFTSAGNGKTAIANAITGKGVPTPPTDSFAQMAQNIGNIQTGITPTGTRNITVNGTYDVTQYEFANVNVSSQGTTLITKNITANGTYNAFIDNADGYSGVTVNVPTGSTNSKCYKKTFDSKITATGWIYLNDADPDIAAHRDDPTFVLTIMNVTDFSALAGRTVALTATNHKYNTYSSSANYGILAYINGTNGGQVNSAVNKAVTTTTPASGGNQICVTTDGKIGIYGSSTTSWEAGTYVAICGW